MTANPTQKTASPDVDAVCVRLEGLRGKGYFSEPRNVSNVWCGLKDDGHLVNMVALGEALFEMSEQKGTLVRTLMADGLLGYVDVAKAGPWQNIDGPGAAN